LQVNLSYREAKPQLFIAVVKGSYCSVEVALCLPKPRRLSPCEGSKRGIRARNGEKEEEVRFFGDRELASFFVFSGVGFRVVGARKVMVLSFRAQKK